MCAPCSALPLFLQAPYCNSMQIHSKCLSVVSLLTEVLVIDLNPWVLYTAQVYSRWSRFSVLSATFTLGTFPPYIWNQSTHYWSLGRKANHWSLYIYFYIWNPLARLATWEPQQIQNPHWVTRLIAGITLCVICSIHYLSLKRTGRMAACEERVWGCKARVMGNR